MSHNPRIRAPGQWIDGFPVLSGEYELFDQRQYYAIHELGGTWAIEGDVLIGAQTTQKWTFGCPLELIDTVAVSAGFSVGATGHIDIASGGSVNVASGGALNVASGGTLAVNGNVSTPLNMTATQPAATADPGANNQVHATNVAKAWARMPVGGGAVSISDGYNVASVSLSTMTNSLSVTFARAMANANYAVVFGVEDDASVLAYPVINGTKSTSGFDFNLWSITGGGALVTLATASTRKVSFQVFARQ